MVRLKIAYWEFDFEAVCPTLDHDLLSQAHMQALFCLLLSVQTDQKIFREMTPQQCDS